MTDPATCSHVEEVNQRGQHQRRTTWERVGERRNFFKCRLCKAIGYAKSVSYGYAGTPDGKHISAYVCNALVPDSITKAPTSCGQVAIQRWGTQKRCVEHYQKRKRSRDEEMEAIKRAEERAEDMMEDAFARISAQTEAVRPARKSDDDDSDSDPGAID